jgi:membrane-associated phospholipid phosphatase
MAAAWPGSGGAVGQASGTATATPASTGALAPTLHLDLPAFALRTGGALAATGLLSLHALQPNACRWCEPPAFDRGVRRALRWPDTSAAAGASDLLQVGVPAGAGLAVALLAWRDGRPREAGEDLAVVTEAVVLASLATTAAKVATARLRPNAWAAGEPSPGRGSLGAFWSGHTSSTFAAAAAAAQVARLRGRRGWRWLAATALAGAAATGWLRVAGDRHWATDVLAGAAAGTAIGLALPGLVLRPGP